MQASLLQPLVLLLLWLCNQPQQLHWKEEEDEQQQP